MTYIKDINYYNLKTLQFILTLSAATFSGQLFINPIQSNTFIISSIILTITIVSILLVNRKMGDYIKYSLAISNHSLTIFDDEQIMEKYSLDSEEIKYIKVQFKPSSMLITNKQFIEIHSQEGMKTYYFQTTSRYNLQKLIDLIPAWKNNGIQVHQL